MGIGTVAAATAFEDLLKLLNDEGGAREAGDLYFNLSDFIASMVLYDKPDMTFKNKYLSNANGDKLYRAGAYDNLDDKQIEQYKEFCDFVGKSNDCRSRNRNAQLLLQSKYVRKRLAGDLVGVYKDYLRYLSLKESFDKKKENLTGLKSEVVDFIENKYEAEMQQNQRRIAEIESQRDEQYSIVQAEYDKQNAEGFAKYNADVTNKDYREQKHRQEYERLLEAYNEYNKLKIPDVNNRQLEDKILTQYGFNPTYFKYRVIPEGYHVCVHVLGVTLYDVKESNYGGTYGKFVFVTEEGARFCWATSVEKNKKNGLPQEPDVYTPLDVYIDGQIKYSSEKSLVLCYCKFSDKADRLNSLGSWQHKLLKEPVYEPLKEPKLSDYIKSDIVIGDTRYDFDSKGKIEQSQVDSFTRGIIRIEKATKDLKMRYALYKALYATLKQLDMDVVFSENLIYRQDSAVVFNGLLTDSPGLPCKTAAIVQDLSDKILNNIKTVPVKFAAIHRYYASKEYALCDCGDFYIISEWSKTSRYNRRLSNKLFKVMCVADSCVFDFNDANVVLNISGLRLNYAKYIDFEDEGYSKPVFYMRDNVPEVEGC